VLDAKVDAVLSCPSIHEKDDDARVGRARGDRCDDIADAGVCVVVSGEVGLRLAAEDAGRDCGVLETGGALDVRSGIAGDVGGGDSKLAAASAVASCSVVSSMGSGIEESSK
jgi:hypothetical protein